MMIDGFDCGVGFMSLTEILRPLIPDRSCARGFRLLCLRKRTVAAPRTFNHVEGTAVVSPLQTEGASDGPGV
jgi:hypothetical protein